MQGFCKQGGDGGAQNSKKDLACIGECVTRMIRGLYISATGMYNEMTKADVSANNLANVNTPGFKKDEAVLRGFTEYLVRRTNDSYTETLKGLMDQRPPVGYLGAGSYIEGVYSIHTLGTLKPSENPLDLAIRGDGFFTVLTPGGLRYTRAGNFQVNDQGYLVTVEGYQVLVQGGPDQRGLPVQILGQKVVVAEDGTIQVDDVEAGTLRLVSFRNPFLLAKEGGSLFSPTQGSGQESIMENASVLQGSIEMSNVNAVTEMVNMIKIMRLYESNSRMVTAQDGTLDRLINEVGGAF